KYAQEPKAVSDGRRQTWFSSLVCRLNQPMRFTQAELESRLDWRPCEADKAYEAHKTYNDYRHPQGLEEIITPYELQTLRRMACLREIGCLHEVATPREVACLRELTATRKPQMLGGLDMRGWLAAPLSGRGASGGRNLGVIQLSDKYDGEF